MDYRLELLEDGAFENLINSICQHILGIGLISFSEGKDGGRDGKFIGTAQNYPSTKSPWTGKFIIQAKHTANSVASCSDIEFETIVGKEILKIKKLKAKNEIDNYLLFTNRKYSGIKGERLTQRIISETGIQFVAIIGKETINNQYLNANKAIVKQYQLNKHHLQFEFSDEEIKEIIMAFKMQLPEITTKLKEDIDKLRYDFKLVDKSIKNQKNGLNETYFQEEIVEKSLMEFSKIESFLEKPINAELKDYYFDTAHELNQVIRFQRDDFNAFEELFPFIYQLICDGAPQIKGAKRHVTTFLHYMYYECLIGKK
ncbi:MAG: hypothetical protein ACI976_000348 [Aureispira sp.]|jgi:hypothetical protein